MVLRTYATVFDRVAVWYGLGSDLFLLGINGDAPLSSIAQLREKLRRAEYQKAMERMRLGSLAALLAHELLPERVLTDGQLEGPLHTITHPRLGYEAARAFFFPGSARMPLLIQGGRAARERGAGVAYFERLLGEVKNPQNKRGVEVRWSNYVKELCKHRMPECVASLAKWFRDQPRSRVRHDLTTTLGQLDPTLGSRFQSRDVRRASELYWPRPKGSPKEINAAMGGRMNRLFVDAYHHLAPFDPEALLAVWDRCTAPSDEQCEKGRRQAIEIIEGRSIPGERGLRISLGSAGVGARPPAARSGAPPAKVVPADDDDDEQNRLPAPEPAPGEEPS